MINFDHSSFAQDREIDSSPKTASSKVDQGVQANELAKPNLNLSTYLEQEEDNNRSVSIALQTGDSIRESRDATNADQVDGEPRK